MSSLVIYPSHELKQVSSVVKEIDAELRSLIDEMVNWMYTSKGVGFAAPQLGSNKRIIVIDPSAGESANEMVVMINPIITKFSQDFSVDDEGCLSIPGVFVTVRRNVSCIVDYLDVEGNKQTQECNGWKARIVQHEIDHLDGIMMIDRIGPMARKMALKNFASSQLGETGT
jgi:peptide deformylase